MSHKSPPDPPNESADTASHHLDLRADIDSPLTKREAVLLIGSLLKMVNVAGTATAAAARGNAEQTAELLQRVLSDSEKLQSTLFELAYGQAGNE